MGELGMELYARPASGRVALPYRGRKENLPELYVCEIGYCWDTKEVFVGTSNGNILIDIPLLIDDLEPLAVKLASEFMKPAVIEKHRKGKRRKR